MIYAVSFKHKIPDNVLSMDVTSRSSTWGRHFSPFSLGPVDLYGGYVAKNIENAYQFSKVYAEYSTVDELPAPHYWEWAQKGWENLNLSSILWVFGINICTIGGMVRN